MAADTYTPAMCGRYNIIPHVEAWMDAFAVLQDHFHVTNLVPRYNISPSTPPQDGSDAIAARLTRVPIVRIGADGARELCDAIWPLIPFWGKGHIPKYSTANARCESMADKPAYRHAWRQRQRAIVPMSGYYEWQREAGQSRKQPYHIHAADQRPLAAAGLWDVSYTPANELVLSMTIVTCDPTGNALCTAIHNRMPVFLDSKEYNTWLRGDSDEALTLAKPYPAERMAAYPISTKVNNPGFDEASILAPLR